MNNFQRRLVRVAAAVVACLTFSSPVYAAILDGSVSFNGGTGLFTYSYTLDNTNGPSPIDQLSILVDSTTNTDGPDFFLLGINHTDPTNWLFGVGSSGIR